MSRPLRKRSLLNASKNPREDAKPRQPTFKCAQHGRTMEFNKGVNAWMCNVEGCRTVRAVDRDGSPDSVTRLRGFPQVIGRYDKDGDAHYSLYYPDNEIVIDLPFIAVRDASFPGGGQGMELTVRLPKFVVFSADNIVIEQSG